MLLKWETSKDIETQKDLTHMNTAVVNIPDTNTNITKLPPPSSQRLLA